MSWFGNIVGQINEEMYNTSKKLINELPGSQIKHEDSAFVTGDTIIFRSNHGVVTGKITGIKRIGDIANARTKEGQDANEKVIAFSVNNVNSRGKTVEKETFRRFTDPNVYACKEWLAPILHFTNETSLYPGKGNIIAYEMGGNGVEITFKGEKKQLPNVLCVVIKETTKGRKHYYNHDNGEYLGTLDYSAERQGASRVLGQRGVAKPVVADINSVTKYHNLFFPLAEEWVIFTKRGDVYAWNLDEAEYIGAMCPWLQNMEAKWATADGSKIYQSLNPFRKNGEFPPITPVQVPQEFKHLFQDK